MTHEEEKTFLGKISAQVNEALKTVTEDVEIKTDNKVDIGLGTIAGLAGLVILIGIVVYAVKG